MENSLISLSNIPYSISIIDGEYIFRFVLPKYLISNSITLKEHEFLVINDKNYILESRVDITDFIILKCKEEK